MQNGANSHSTNTSPLKRGIIIVDSSALLSLCLPIDEKFRCSTPSKYAGEVPRYVDMLVMLSQHGYDIIIPEMVAFESGRVLRDGLTFRNGIPLSPLKQLAKHFLEKVGQDEYPNIHIQPPGAAQTKAAEFIKKMWRSARQMPLREGRTVITQLMQQDRVDFGEMAAADLIRYDYKKSEAPIFYLSTDKEAFSRVFNAANMLGRVVGKVNLAGMIAAIKNNYLSQDVGLANCDTDRIIISIFDDTYRLNNKVNVHIHYPSKVIIDSSKPYGTNSDFFFRNSLRGIQGEIEKTQAQAKKDEEKLRAIAPPVSPAEKFIAN